MKWHMTSYFVSAQTDFDVKQVFSLTEVKGREHTVQPIWVGFLYPVKILCGDIIYLKPSFLEDPD